MTLTDAILPDESKLCVNNVQIVNGTMTISVSSADQKGVCPHCQAISQRVHSCYQRQPSDLPFAEYNVRLDMLVRRFFCDNDRCETKTFAEGISKFIKPYARRTNRLANQQQQVAFALGGNAGSRLLTILGMPVSHDTLIRLIRKVSEPEIHTPRVLGVDDWAKSKGRSYGTILVDLELGKAIDLLPDRTSESLANWLKGHPGVEIISRDRGSEYIKGASDGAPDAIQVADRWHLMKNLRDALERVLETKRACLKATANQPKQEESSGQEKKLNASQKLTMKDKESLSRQEKRLERYKTVKELHERGLYINEIARRLGMARETVKKYIQSDECPTYLVRQSRRSKLDRYMSYMTERWESGCHNGVKIWGEICKLGYSGSRRIVSEWATGMRKSSKSSSCSNPSCVPLSARKASWLLVKQESELTEEDKQSLERMKQADDKVADAYALGQRFTQMIRERQPESLIPWLDDMANSGIDILRQFSKSIKQDLAAVMNALSLPWSNGQVEGQVNRLKLIKRQMYGRAKFDLLRKRVIANPLRC